MNGSKKILTIAGGVLFALFAIASILLGDSNAIAHLFLYLMAGGGLLAIVSPRAGFVLLLISCAYVDLLKRLMVISGRLAIDDLYYVLGLSPVLLAVILGSIIVRGAVGSIEVNNFHLKLLSLGGVMVIVTTILALMGGDRSAGKIMQSVANGGFYATLLFVVPVLYPTTGQVLRLLKLVLWIHVPVGIYGVVQKVWGFQEFEIQYLMSGLSIEVKQLFTDRVRAFSTLNSPTSLGAICGVFVVLPIFLARLKNKAGKRFIGMLPAVSMSVIFFAGMLASTSRTALVVVLVMTAGIYCFQSLKKTVLYYGFGGAAFVALLFGAEYLLTHIEQATDVLLSSLGRSLSEESINLNTFSDRLQGFASVLANPDAYTLFGYGPERGLDPKDPLYNHDLLSSILVRFGAVPLLVMLASASGFAIWAHLKVLSIPDEGRRKLGAGMLSMVLSLIAISITSGNVLAIFPVNTLFWMGVSATIVCVGVPAMRAAKESESASSATRINPWLNTTQPQRHIV
jgi:hypothetical protein